MAKNINITAGAPYQNGKKLKAYRLVFEDLVYGIERAEAALHDFNYVLENYRYCPSDSGIALVYYSDMIDIFENAGYKNPYDWDGEKIIAKYDELLLCALRRAVRELKYAIKHQG